MYYVLFVLFFVSPYISMLMLGLEKGSMIENSDNGTDLNGVDGDDNGDGDDGDGDDDGVGDVMWWDVMWCDRGDDDGVGDDGDSARKMCWGEG